MASEDTRGIPPSRSPLRDGCSPAPSTVVHEKHSRARRPRLLQAGLASAAGDAKAQEGKAAGGRSSPQLSTPTSIRGVRSKLADLQKEVAQIAEPPLVAARMWPLGRRISGSRQATRSPSRSAGPLQHSVSVIRGVEKRPGPLGPENVARLEVRGASSWAANAPGRAPVEVCERWSMCPISSHLAGSASGSLTRRGSGPRSTPPGT